MVEDEQKHRPDLYIGLVCAAGTDLTDVKAQIEAQLSRVGYRVQPVKVSNLIQEVLQYEDFENEYTRIKSLMDGGDLIRKHSVSSQGVASLIIAELRRLRGDDDNVPTSTAYVIDSLKNPAEVDLLDRVYGRNFYTVSTFLPKDQRIENLKNKIAKSKHEPPSEDHEKCSKELVEEDEKGQDSTDQNVQDTFPLADFFINATLDIENQLTRFVNLVFQEPFTTPTKDEYLMFVAKATALRSCDLSRQVGAVIANELGWILATGCNEVPMPGGGFFEEPMAKVLDNRDHKKQFDPNYIEIQRSLIEFISLLKEAHVINDEEDEKKLVDRILHGEFKKLMSNARVRNLIEFGRVVHAEMHAISQAAAAGRPVKDAILYVTTFPCHGCARHIISSGIAEVVFIEPYPKSLTLHLYEGEISMVDAPSGEHTVRPKAPVKFRSFHGISPTLYQRVFRHRPRKDNLGTKADWQPRMAIPAGAAFGVERVKMEVAASQGVAKIIESIRTEESGNIEAGVSDVGVARPSASPG
jgi:deoxycytidylate deaminase